MQVRVRKALLALGTGTLVLAVAANAGAQAPKGLVGTWTLDSAKSTFSPGPAPKSMRHAVRRAIDERDGNRRSGQIQQMTQGCMRHRCPQAAF